MVGADVPLRISMSYVLHISRTRSRRRYRHLAAQDRLAVLWDKHEVVVAMVDGVEPMTYCRHYAQSTASLLKASPKGEGVHPSPVGTLRGSM